MRFEWGQRGAEVLAAGSSAVAIVDVLSFSTAVSIAAEQGAIVYPYRVGDHSAAAFADRVGARLAGVRGETGLSLSPPSLASLGPGDRVVLPSPNGATCSLVASEGCRSVVAGCLRNAAAVAAWLVQRGAPVSIVACGEMWPDGSLRPAVEDLLGAGAIIRYLEAESLRLSPEARVAHAAFRAFGSELDRVLAECASGRELIDRGYPQDVAAAAMADVASVVPVLVDGAYVPF